MLLIKKMPLQRRQLFMDRTSEVVKSKFNARCDMSQASCVHSVNTS